MFKKILFFLLILTIFISVPVYAEGNEVYTSEEEEFISVPVYAEDDKAYILNEEEFADILINTKGAEVYTLEPGKVYVFRKNSGETLTVGFSDLVLCNRSGVYEDYLSISRYNNYVNYSSFSAYPYYYVYNVNDKEVTMTVTEGTIIGVDVYKSVFSSVMYDATETNFQITNIDTDIGVYYRRFDYNEDDGSLTMRAAERVGEGDTKTYTRGKGIMIVRKLNLQERLSIDGVYEVSNTIRFGFFQVSPWILRMDLAGMIRVLLDQLSMLLPVALVILSVFLLISLAIYIVRLFL